MAIITSGTTVYSKSTDNYYEIKVVELTVSPTKVVIDSYQELTDENLARLTHLKIRQSNLVESIYPVKYYKFIKRFKVDSCIAYKYVFYRSDNGSQH